jgi:uncharacterized OB-fold protein
MPNFLADFTKQAVSMFGHEAADELQRRLREDRVLCGTRCASCGSVAFPPRSFCPDCFHADVTWVPIGEGATLYAFTTQKRGLRFAAPAVIGVADVPGVGFVLGPMKGSLDDLDIGMRLSVEVIDIDGGLAFHRFVPGDA